MSSANNKQAVVLSASRMTDMPKFYPAELMAEVDARLQRGLRVHTLVLWTKHPRSLLADPLYSYLLRLKAQGVQLYGQLTITGLGGRAIGVKKGGVPWYIEPNAPRMEDSLAALPDVIELLSKPERLRVRIDPLIRVADLHGTVVTNLICVRPVIKSVAALGVRSISFSFLEANVHKKVDRRFRNIGCEILPPTDDDRARAAEWFARLESEFGVSIQACCVPGFRESSCIDGRLLQSLHDRHEPLDLHEPRKRTRCACTASIDLGGWPPKQCFTGCDYCYANTKYIE